MSPQRPASPLRSSLGVDGALLLMALVWGSSYLIVKDLTRVLPVVVILTLRFVVSGVVLVVVSSRRSGEWSPRVFRVGAAYGLLQSVVLFLEAWGVTHTSATHAGLLISLAIVWTPLYENAVLRRWLPRRFFVSTVTALGGVALLISSHGLTRVNSGDIIFVMAALLRTLYFGSLGVQLSRAPIDVMRFNAVACVVSALVYASWGTSATFHRLTHITLQQWSAIGYLALVSTVVGFLVQTWAIQRTSAARASLLMGTEPLWSTLVALLVGGETLNIWGALGAVLLIASTFYGQRVEAQFRRS